AMDAEERRVRARRLYANAPEKYRRYSLESARRHAKKTKARITRWRTANRERSREYGRARHARKQGAPAVEKIDRAAIIARDNSTCYLCGTGSLTNEITLDHVLPLSRGGSHTADNLRVACVSCNCRKK